MNAWVRFLIRYSLTGAIGAGLIIVLVPFVRDSSSGTDIETAVTDIKTRTLDLREALAMAAEEMQPIASGPVGRQEPNEKTIDDGVPAGVAAEPYSPPVKEEPPPAQPPATALRENPRWGVVSEPNVSYYSKKGSFQGHLPSGELLDVLDIRQNKSEMLAVCRPVSGRNHPVILVKAEKIDIYPTFRGF